MIVKRIILCQVKCIPLLILSFMTAISLEVINELKAAGAEAIGINGVRILGNSRISCGGPTINVGDDQRFAPPFVIHAIGDPDALAGYFQSPDSIYHILTFYGLEFSIKKNWTMFPSRDITVKWNSNMQNP